VLHAHAIVVKVGSRPVNLARDFYLLSITTVALGKSDKGYPGHTHPQAGKVIFQTFDEP
jgi:hypothetical protein